MWRNARITVLFVLVGLWFSGQDTAASSGEVGGAGGRAGANIISVQDREIVLSNPLGCKLAIYRDGGKYGLGTFYFHDVPLGGTIKTFLNEDNHYVWDEYKADRYEIIENTPERATIKFYGTVGWTNVESRWTASITLTNKNTGYELHEQVEPYTWAGRFHPLYVAAPFSNAAMQFVQYPLENPLRPPFAGHWYVTPDVGKVPFMFGKQTIQGTDYFVGVGYTLVGQDYTQGKLEYDTVQPDTPFRVYFPYLRYAGGVSWMTASGEAVRPADEKAYFRLPPYELRMIVSTADNQAACIRGYRENSGFDISTPIRRKISDSVAAVMRAYKDVPLKTVYIPGKGYRGRAWANSDERGDYYTYVWPGTNVQIAFLLYKYWEGHRSETWAKDRAIEMANFFMASQLPSGVVARNWDEEKQEYTTEAPSMPAFGFIYCPWGTARGSENLYKLYLERKRVEGVEEVKWKESALRGMDWLVRRINAEGMLAHTYDKDDKSCGMIGGHLAAALTALDYIYQQTHEDRYDRARAKLEAWYYKTFAEPNEYYNAPDDCVTWRPPAGSVQLKDNDAIETLPFAAYSTVRYMETKEPRYLRWAKDVAAYGWLTRMPVEMPGSKMPTRGVLEEQSIWPMYDLPWAAGTCRCFAYLTLLTGDPFYARYYKLIIQTQLAFQQYDQKYPFFASVLAMAPDIRELPFSRVVDSRRRPRDRLWETIDGKIGVWLLFYTSFFIEDMTAPYTYSYFGGKDWGVGMDYELPFQPNFGDNPYVMAASTDLTSGWWNSQEHSLNAVLDGKVDSGGTLRVKWDAAKYPPARVAVEISGGAVAKGKWHYEAGDQMLIVEYVQHQPSMQIKVRAQ